MCHLVSVIVLVPSAKVLRLTLTPTFETSVVCSCLEYRIDAAHGDCVHAADESGHHRRRARHGDEEEDEA